jgi:RNA polymerase sigma-70 factor (ECF subfamily)
LLALMLLHEARSDGRLTTAGELVPLEEQDRSRWDRIRIAEAEALLEGALRRREPGPYQIQAAIAACHAVAEQAGDTDWAQIAGLYDQLYRIAPTPVVALNRAVAIGMAEGPDAGLLLVEDLAASADLAEYHLLAATRADLLRRAGRHAEAVTAYREALAQAGTDGERSFLQRRIRETSA